MDIKAIRALGMGAVLLLSNYSVSSDDRCDADAERIYRAAEFDQNGSRPAWWGNDLGEEPVVLPGYSPIEVKGNTIVELSERSYKWGKSFFPNSIESKGSVLVEKMGLVIEVKGKDIVPVPASVVFKEVSPARVIVSATGQVVPGLMVTVETRVEYDGVAMSEVRLDAGRPIRVDQVSYEALVAGSPSTRVISFSAKDIRKQKDRNDMLELPYKGEFLNVIGVADGTRSFWWFADNAEGWTWNGAFVTEVKKEGKDIGIRQMLVGDTWVLNGVSTYKLNFLATPVRKMGSEWRSRRIIKGVPSKSEAEIGGEFKLWWSNAFAHDAFPYTYYPGDTKARLFKHDRLAYPGKKKNREIVHRDRMKYGAHWIPYFSAHVLSGLDPALRGYRRFWEVQPGKVFRNTVRPYTQVFEKPVLTHRATGYTDYLIWRMDEEIDRLDVEGIYLDHGPPIDSCSEYNGAWVDSNGRVQASLDILGLRNFLKRLRTLFHQKGKDGYIFIHDSNREIVPAYTFAYATVDGEQYRSGRVRGHDYLSYVGLDELRMRLSPDQYGIVNVWLPVEWNYHKNDSGWEGSAQQREAYRRLMSLALLHDALVWPVSSFSPDRSELMSVMDEFGVNEAEFIGYWDSRIPVQVDDENVRVSAYYRGDPERYLLIVSNVDNTATEVELGMDLSRFGDSDGAVYVKREGDVERNKRRPTSTVSMSIAPRQYEWVIIERLAGQ